jgi:hypothetical protein
MEIADLDVRRRKLQAQGRRKKREIFSKAQGIPLMPIADAK